MHSPFWSSLTAALFGCLYGAFLAVLTWIGAKLTTTSALVDTILAVVGFLGAGYISYTPAMRSFGTTSQEEKRNIAGGCAIMLYSAASLVLFLGPAIVHYLWK